MKNILESTTHSISIYDDSTEVITTAHQRMLKRLSSLRKKIETGGVDFNGTIIKTDEGSLAKISSTMMALQAGITDSVDWKGQNGWIRSVDYNQMVLIATTVTKHVQKAFSVENVIASKIEAMTELELESFDLDAEWASYYQ